MDSSFGLMQVLSWAGTAAGVVAYLIALVAAVGFFVVAGRTKAKALNVAGIGMAIFALSGLMVRIFWAAAPRMLDYSEGTEILYSSVNTCQGCMDVIAWSMVALGLLMAKPAKPAK
jgi:hypothetical protein